MQGWNNGRLLAENWPHQQDNCPFPDIFSKEGLVYTVVLTCVAGVTEITTLIFFVAGRLTSQVGPLHTMLQTSTPGQLAYQLVRSIIRLVWHWLDHFWKVIFSPLWQCHTCHGHNCCDNNIPNTSLTLSMHQLPHHTCTVIYSNIINIWYTCHTKNILTSQTFTNNLTCVQQEDSNRAIPIWYQDRNQVIVLYIRLLHIFIPICKSIFFVPLSFVFKTL